MKVFRWSKKLQDNRGDTIVEVLIAITIVAAILAGAYVSARHSLYAVRDSQERAEALKITQQQVEILRSAYTTNPSGFNTPSLFCYDNLNAVGFSAINLPTFNNTTPQTDDWSNYPAQCNDPTYKRYWVSIAIADPATKTYVFRARWDRVDGNGRDEVKLIYRINQGFANVSPPPGLPGSPPAGPVLGFNTDAGQEIVFDSCDPSNPNLHTIRIGLQSGPSTITITRTGGGPFGRWRTTDLNGGDNTAPTEGPWTPLNGSQNPWIVSPDETYDVVIQYINSTVTKSIIIDRNCPPGGGGSGGGGGGGNNTPTNYTVVLTNSSQGATPFTCRWTLGDGTTRNDNCQPGNQFPHTYAVAGTYTITLNGTDALGRAGAQVTLTRTVPY